MQDSFYAGRIGRAVLRDSDRAEPGTGLEQRCAAREVAPDMRRSEFEPIKGVFVEGIDADIDQ